MKNLNIIPFGAQYYRAPTPKDNKWEYDIKRISELGFNTIKIWLQWRWNHPDEGKYYFEDIDRIMDIAQKHDIKVIINIICDVAPAWFFIQHPESIMITSDGRKLYPQATSYRQIGGAPGPCYHHEEGFEYRRKWIEAAAERYALHPALLCWDLWNEPELTCGILREEKQENIICYCDQSVSSFRNWLKEKFETVDALNSRWGRNYQSWQEIEAPRSSATFTDMIDWRMFFADTIVDELGMRVSAVKKFDNEHPVMVHTVPMPYFNMMTCGSNDYLLAQKCDMFGNSLGSFPFSATTATSAAYDKTVINAEIHAISGDAFNRPKTPTFEELKKHIFVPLGRGVKGFLFWQYRPETIGMESPAWGLTDLQGCDTEWLEYSVRINNAIQQNSDLLLKSNPLKAKVAVVNSSQDEVFSWCLSKSSDLYYYSVFGAFEALYQNNFNVDVISEGYIKDNKINNYNVIYFPLPYYMDSETANKLKEWIEQGGILISEALFAGIRADDNLHSEIIPGFGFDKVFGVQEGRVISASFFSNAYGTKWGDVNTDENVISINHGDMNAKGYYYCEELIPRDSEPIAFFDDGKIAATCATYGNGKAIMIGTLPGYIVGKNKDADTAKFICKLISQYGGINPHASSKARIDLLYKDEVPVFAVITNQVMTSMVEVVFSDKELAGKNLVNIINGDVIEIKQSSYGPIAFVQIQPGGIDGYKII